MSDEELEKRTRDLEESSRNLQRMGGETVAAIRSLHERLSKSQEYQLRDNRLTAEELKDVFKEYSDKQEIKCFAHDKRISSLERWRTYVNGIGKGLTAASAAVVAWWKYGHHLK